MKIIKIGIETNDCYGGCFREMVQYLVNDKWFLEQIENLAESTEEIPDVEHGIHWLPRYLKQSLKGLLKSILKQVSIGHAIVHSTRPRSCLSPWLFSLLVEFGYMFGSKWLLVGLNKLGFCLGTKNISNYVNDNMKGAFTLWMAHALFMQWVS